MDSQNFQDERAFASQLDACDPLASYQAMFSPLDAGLLYMDGNSLGRPTIQAHQIADQVIQFQWGQRLIRSWPENWIDAPRRCGEKIARLIRAEPGQVIVSDSTSINLFKLTLAALALRPERRQIVSDELNFPSDLYIFQGCARLLDKGHQIRLAASPDGIHMDPHEIASLLSEDTALLSLSHVAFKSGYLYPAQWLTEQAHRAGALVIWDLSHSVGAVPIDLDRWGVDFAVGCTYKYLNGGPGAPAFLYVRKELQPGVASPIWGWFGEQAPFAFELDYHPAPGVERFLCGTPPILSLLVMEQSLDLLLQAGIEALRARSLQLSAYLIDLFDHQLAQHGFSLGTPRQSHQRGSHVSLRHPLAYQINRALIEEMNVIPDFREPDNIRLGLAPLYTSYTEVWDTIDRIRRVMVDRRYEHFKSERLQVT